MDGKRKSTVATTPPSGAFAISSLPWCKSTILRVTVSPKPVP